MRLKPLKADELNEVQKPLDATMRDDVKKYLKGFVSEQEGALVGPFPALLHFPQFGKPTWQVFEALAENSTLPKPAHEVAILTVGARLHSRYELYSHERVAASTGLSAAKIATITVGGRPADLSDAEGAAYDVAHVLTSGGQVGDTLYTQATEIFGETGFAELAYLIGCYQLVSTLLNAYDVPVPE